MVSKLFVGLSFQRSRLASCFEEETGGKYVSGERRRGFSLEVMFVCLE